MFVPILIWKVIVHLTFNNAGLGQWRKTQSLSEIKDHKYVSGGKEVITQTSKNCKTNPKEIWRFVRLVCLMF